MNNEFVYMMENMAHVGVSFSSFGPVLGLVAFVFSSLSLYTIAQRREIRNAWLAWIPVVNVWILGSISDQYRYVVKGEVKNKRKVLLSVSILNAILSCVAFVRFVVFLITVFSGAYRGAGEMELIMQLLGSLAFYIPVVILGIVELVLDAIALYDVYTSCDPANNVLYLVLSLIPGISSVARPLFLFLCRDRDEGMPPRRENVVENPAEF